ncbi:androgen-induced gene 1 protein-like isoform X2 [Periplaneta americana]|uniref:androgen-induced gene 1 protein-like isoform X2 n=1 Tax=Periplaneta americana TaxID=6978 RepID=UPI0037E8D59D
MRGGGAAARWFHAAAAPYLVCMDVVYALKVALQVYFFLAFGYDVIEPVDYVFVKQLKRVLRVFKAVFFSSVVIPTSILVSVNYWVLDSLLDPALLEDTHVLQDYVPRWIDHNLHTSVLLFSLAELLLCYRPYPRWASLGQVRSTVVVLAYTSWVILAVLIGSAWPYTFLKYMTMTEKLGYLMANCALAAWSYSLGEYINTIIWGKRNLIT